MTAPRIVFAGTPEFAVPTLRALADSPHRPLAVFTQPDRPAGRGRGLRSSAVKQAARNLGIPVHQPERLDAAAQATLRGLEPDLVVVVAYGLILPQAVLDLPRLGCWNIHASLLPRWRGAAPIQRAIEAGDPQTGVCIMQMDAGLDTGPVLLRLSTPIGPTDTGNSLHERLSELGAEALLRCLELLSRDELPVPLAQSTEGVRYAAKLDKAQASLDWRRSAAELERQVRAFNPWPVAWCEIEGQRLRVWHTQVIETTANAEPGTILSRSADGLEIAIGAGRLRLLEVQGEGGRRMPVAEFLKAGRRP